MIEQQATVVSLEGDQATIAIARQSACGSCAAKSGCGTSVIASLFPQRRPHLQVPNTLHAVVGDQVLIGLPEAGLQQASLLLYGVPLLTLLVGALLGQSWGGSEPQSILGGLLGAGLGLWFVRWQSGRSTALQPVMLRRLPAIGVTLDSLTIR